MKNSKCDQNVNWKICHRRVTSGRKGEECELRQIGFMQNAKKTEMYRKFFWISSHDRYQKPAGKFERKNCSKGIWMTLFAVSGEPEKYLRFANSLHKNCKGCESIYVGQTSRRVTARLLEYQGKDS